jgi:hypothetical protein
MIFWQGWGIIAIAIPFFIALTAQILADKITGIPDFYKHCWWLLFLVSAISAVLVFAVGHYLERKPAKIVIEKETGKEIQLRQMHTLILIPVKYWSIIWLGLGIYLAIQGVK